MDNKKNFDSPNTKHDRIMRGVNLWTAYYRNNPHRYAKEILNLNLKLFQEIVLNLMFININFTFLASRGLGKTFMVAIFCAIRCVLYPETKIIIVSGTRGQANEVLSKIIKELLPKSNLFEMEIKQYKLNGQEAYIDFHNGSTITVATASDNSRHFRANIVVIDEFRMVDKNIIDTVIRKFLIAPRQPAYLSNPKYAHLSERNKSIYLSSCWLKAHWSWEHTKTSLINMLNGRKYGLCALPYQIAIKENLLNRLDVEDEMSESTFNEISFMMEMSCLFFGENENAFFKYEDLIKARRIQNPLYELDTYQSVQDKIIKYRHKDRGIVRLVCVDIAVMSSKKNKNDATAIFILELVPTDNGQYMRNVVYLETYDGGHSKTQAIKIRKLFDDLDCDYIVIDANGVGNGVYDNLVDDIVDDITGKVYPALQCCNDKEMADKYKGKDLFPRKVIYSIKANAKFNSTCAFSLRDVLTRGKMRLLESEQEFERRMSTNKYYKELSPELKLEVKLPYIQTNLLINELVNLEYVAQGNEVKIKEHSDRRKDRYSALSYGNQIANELELKLKKPTDKLDNFIYKMRPPSTLKRK